MLQYIAKRLLGLVADAADRRRCSCSCFVHLLPGDPARLAAGPDATPETVALVRKDLGLDRSLPRAVRPLRRPASLRWDFGTSLRTKRPVATEIAERFMPTLLAHRVEHGVVGHASAWRSASLSAVWRNRWPDRVGMTLAVSGISFPAFALGMVLMQVFSVQLGWLPTVGADSLAPLHPAVADARRGGRGDHGALHALVVRRHPR